MGAIGFFVLWLGYSVFYYGVDQIRGGNNGLLDLAIPGRYKALPTDAMIGGGASASSAPPNSAAPPAVRGPASAAGGGPSQGPGGTNTGNT